MEKTSTDQFGRTVTWKMGELTDSALDDIADCIKRGFTSGGLDAGYGYITWELNYTRD